MDADDDADAENEEAALQHKSKRRKVDYSSMLQVNATTLVDRYGGMHLTPQAKKDAKAKRAAAK